MPIDALHRSGNQQQLTVQIGTECTLFLAFPHLEILTLDLVQHSIEAFPACGATAREDRVRNHTMQFVAMLTLLVIFGTPACFAAFKDAAPASLDDQLGAKPSPNPDPDRLTYNITSGSQPITYTFGMSSGKAKWMTVNMRHSKDMDARSFAVQFFGGEDVYLGYLDRRTKRHPVYRVSSHGSCVRYSNGYIGYVDSPPIGYAKPEKNGALLKIWAADQIEPKSP